MRRIRTLCDAGLREATDRARAGMYSAVAARCMGGLQQELPGLESDRHTGQLSRQKAVFLLEFPSYTLDKENNFK